MRIFTGVLIIGFLLATGCEEEAKKAERVGSASAEPVAEPQEAAVPEATRSPKDLDVAELQGKLDCKGKTGKFKACRILEEFSTGERFAEDTPSGDGRWMGRAYVISKGEEEQMPLALRAHKIPTAQAGPHELPVRVGTSEIPYVHTPFAKKMVGRLSRGTKANKKNPAYKFLGEFKPQQEWGTMATNGPSLTSVLSDNPIYLRRLGRKRLLWVSPASDATAKPGDGTYGEFWLVIW